MVLPRSEMQREVAGNFVKVPIALLDAVADPGSDLDGRALAVWVALRSYADFGSEQGAAVSDTLASQKAGCSVRTFQRRRDLLKTAGWLNWESGKDAGVTNRYAVLDYPRVGQTDVPLGQTDVPPQSEWPTGVGHNGRQPRASKPRTNTYTPDFEKVWDAYPRKDGKVAAFRVFKATRRRGVELETLLRAASRYAALCRSKRTEAQFIKLAGTFFGPDQWWQDFLEDPVDGAADSVAQSRAEMDALKNAGAPRE